MNHPWLLHVLVVCVFVYMGWLPDIFSSPPVLPARIAGSLVSGWALVRKGRRHALLGFPLLAIPAGLLLFGPARVSVRPTAELGVRVASIVYGLPTAVGFAAAKRGEIELGGCGIAPGRKLVVVQIGYGLGGVERILSH